MGWFDGIFTAIAPAYALKREIARHRLERLREIYKAGRESRRSIEAIDSGRLQYDFVNSRTDADTAISSSLEKLRNYVRQHEYNSGLISGPIMRIADHVVGTGLRFQSRVTPDKKYIRTLGMPRITSDNAEAFNFWAEKHYKTWGKKADARLMLMAYEIQWLLQAVLVRDGEAIVIGRKSKRPDRLIPYCQEIVEIDRLSTPAEEINNPKVRNGIRFDDEGAPSSCFILKYHPGNTLNFMPRAVDYEEVPIWNNNGTRRVIHLFRILRPEQTRGFSWFTAALKDIQNTIRYSEAEMFAALEDACMTGIVKTPAPQTFQQNYTVGDTDSDSDTSSERRIHEFSPGKWHYLSPGEEATIREPSRPNDGFDSIVQAFMRGPANALNIPPEVYNQNWQGMNYSNARTVLLQFYLTCRMLQRYLVDHYCVPTWENVLSDLVAYGKIPAPGYRERKEDYLASEWIPPKREWVDPQKEAAGKEIELNTMTETISGILASKGMDFDEVLEQKANELKRIKEKEEEYGIKIPISSGGTQSEEPEEPPANNKAKVVRLKK